MAALIRGRSSDNDTILQKIKARYKNENNLPENIEDLLNFLRTNIDCSDYNIPVISPDDENKLWEEIRWNILAESSLDGETLDQLEVSRELGWEIAQRTIENWRPIPDSEWEAIKQEIK